MKSSTITTPVLSVARIFLLLFGVAGSDCPPSPRHCPGDMKNGTPGQIMKLGESLHVDAR
jgi:hypothetical protein